ncbi:hypothetical protein Lfu02_44370 [Longispora fulva]|uniref:WD40 repeat protein n=1 Tax=Longispora fulva TaxID=619741 RepID=A0A8J7KJH1_9ACTN|nr:PD40 domain-containing protein [Longispora fulva]MBG6136894.1 WD40 repeat protein [Longispora fulva]GIG60065.1 hypothetical protein Lfu02_44370 [Longispora fulva]
MLTGGGATGKRARATSRRESGRVVRPLVGAAVAVLAALGTAGPVAGASVPPPRPMVFAQDGDVFLTDRTGTFRITTGGGNTWPRISPDHGRIAYTHAGDVWIADVSDPGGHISFLQVSHDGRAGGAAWSPRGDRLAYRTGTAHQGTVVLANVPAPTRRERGTGAPREQVAARAGASRADGWSELREANTVAWSPDGTSLAYPGGECSVTFDDCLSVLDLGTGAESTVVGFGGARQGFATTPSWSADSHRLYFTRQVQAGPVTSMAYDLVGRTTWQIGADGDATPVPLGNGRFLVTSGAGTVTYLPGDGSRQALAPGSQPDWRPKST